MTVRCVHTFTISYCRLAFICVSFKRILLIGQTVGGLTVYCVHAFTISYCRQAGIVYNHSKG